MSWWNPVDDIKHAAKDVTHLASDVVHTGEKLVSDAYDTAKTAVKDTVKVGKDVVDTATKVGSDVVHGHIVDAFKDTGKGIVHTASDTFKAGFDVTAGEVKTAVDLAKNSFKVAGDVNNLAVDSISAINPALGYGLRLGEVFTESAINTAVLKPIDGLEQLAGAGIHAVTGYELPKLDLHLTPDTQGLGIAGKIAEYAGDGVGFVAPLLVTGGATGALASLAIAGKVGEAADIAGVAGESAAALGETAEAASTAGRVADVADVTSDVSSADATSGAAQSRLASGAQRFLDSRYKTVADGAIAGFVFTPSNGNGNILTQRFQAAATNAVTFGTLGAVSRGLTGAADTALTSTLGDTASSAAVRTTERVAVNSASGLVAGAANAETSSILSGHGLASADQVRNSALQFAATGAALDGLSQLSERAAAAKSDPAAAGEGGGGTTNDASFQPTLPEGSALSETAAPIEAVPAEQPAQPASQPDVPSYDHLVSDLQTKGLTPAAIADSIVPGNLLGEGYANRVYAIDGLDGYVARIPKLSVPEFSRQAPLQAVPDYWTEHNLGQPVAQLGDIQILKRVEGNAIKPAPESPSLLSRVKNMIARETPAQRYERQERIIAAMPQTAYDNLAETLIGLQQRGKHFDAVNPGNVLVSDNGFNPVDIGDAPITLPGGAIDGRSAGFGLYEMLRPLTGTDVNQWVPNASKNLQQSYQSIIEKSVNAAQKAGLAVVPDPRLQQLFDVAGIPERYNQLVGNRPEDPALQDILVKSNYYAHSPA